MRWLSFAVLAVLVLSLQGALAPRLEVLGLRPDWALVIVVFLALYATPRSALIGAWVLGAGADLMTLERPGLLSLTYVLLAWGIAGLREYVFRARPDTQFLLTLGAAAAAQAAWVLYRALVYAEPGFGPGGALLEILGGAAYTAIWAPPVHAILLRRAGLFGLRRPRYTHAGMQRWWKSGV
ncbi:MAG TPA: rod shape-determining protein MreD [Phycisphaerae bacterium]|nr:rod shape-determining protein MreD [Phycisphaerae bacterium]HNU44973.1 rod shape-determining protein MreD [Phycisphaerae bacterium]